MSREKRANRGRALRTCLSSVKACAQGIGVLWAVTSMGCALQTTRTARQLEQGDVVLSGSLDEAGTLFIPRINVQAMYGLGDKGDVSAHLGSSGLLHNAGVGARAYLGPKWMLGAQANLMLLHEVDLYASNDLSIFYNGSFRLSTAATKKNAFYGGFQVDLYARQFESFDSGIEDFWINGGGVVGFDLLDHGGLGYQLEGKFTPLFFNTIDGVAMFPFMGNGFEPNILFSAQVGLSIYKRIKTQPSPIAPSESVWLNDIEKEIEQRRLRGDVPVKKKRPEAPTRRAPSQTQPEPSSPGKAPVPERPE